jgi:hypothetical protein
MGKDFEIRDVKYLSKRERDNIFKRQNRNIGLNFTHKLHDLILLFDSISALLRERQIYLTTLPDIEAVSEKLSDILSLINIEIDSKKYDCEGERE